MLKLRAELERAKAIMDLVKKRDRMKKESVSLDFLIFEQKAKIWELRRIYQIPSSAEADPQAPELKKPPKPKPKPVAATSPTPSSSQGKIRLNINGGVVQPVPSEVQTPYNPLFSFYFQIFG